MLVFIAVIVFIVALCVDLIVGLPIYTVIEDIQRDSDERFLLRKGLFRSHYVDMTIGCTWAKDSRWFADCYGTKSNVISKYNRRTNAHVFRKLSKSELSEEFVNRNETVTVVETKLPEDFDRVFHDNTNDLFA